MIDCMAFRQSRNLSHPASATHRVRVCCATTITKLSSSFTSTVSAHQIYLDCHWNLEALLDIESSVAGTVQPAAQLATASAVVTVKQAPSILEVINALKWIADASHYPKLDLLISQCSTRQVSPQEVSING